MDVISGPWDSFWALLPQSPATPVVVSVPHAGIATGPFGDALAPSLDVRQDADLFVDELYVDLPQGAFVRAQLSRFVCDLNRHPDDVSARAVPAHPHPLNSNGRGFVWEVTTTEAPALARPLSWQEWQQRQQIHAAYHGALRTGLQRAQAKFGFAILVDGHSMPSQGRAGHSDPGAARADIVPGNRMGTSCGPTLSAAVNQHFGDNGFRVKFNEPYQGGFITSHHGRPADNVHAIQIEMRRDLYMNEATFTKVEPGFARLRQALSDLLRKLDVFSP